MNSSRIAWHLGPSISVTILITDPSARRGRYAYARSTNARYKGVLSIWDRLCLKEWLFVSLIETEDIVQGRMPPVRTIEKEWAGRGGPMPGRFIFITTIIVPFVKWKCYLIMEILLWKYYLICQMEIFRPIGMRPTMGGPGIQPSQPKGSGTMGVSPRWLIIDLWVIVGDHDQ